MEYGSLQPTTPSLQLDGVRFLDPGEIMTKRLTDAKLKMKAAENLYQTGATGPGKDMLDIIQTQLLAEIAEVLYQINDSIARTERDAIDLERLAAVANPPPPPPTKKGK
jgi:hypothetical protein